jgi:amidohydrolase
MGGMTVEELRAHVDAVLPEVVGLRHDLHSHPELSGEEERTARVVSEWLTRAGIPHRTGVGGGHGIVGTIEGGAGPGKTFALRGDMDALPITEENEVAYRSQNAGVMHACGHDGHTANLMGAALVLKRVKDKLPGRVQLLFQPAEETVNGAESMIRGGALEGVDAILMLHGWPDLGVGQIGVRTGPVMASADIFTVTLHGKGGHGAYPHRTIDPLVAGAEVVAALQTVVAREVSPTAPAVVSVTNFHAGTGAYNVIPEKAELKGTVRTLDRELRDSMAERVERVVKGVCQALRCEYTFEYGYGTPVTVNDPAIADLVRAVGRDVLGPENVIELPEPTMGAEDFAYYLEHVPGAMFRLGVNCPYHLHTPKYDFGDGPLAPGVLMMVEAARRYLTAA